MAPFNVNTHIILGNEENEKEKKGRTKKRTKQMLDIFWQLQNLGPPFF